MSADSRSPSTQTVMESLFLRELCFTGSKIAAKSFRVRVAATLTCSMKYVLLADLLTKQARYSLWWNSQDIPAKDFGTRELVSARASAFYSIVL